MEPPAPRSAPLPPIDATERTIRAVNGVDLHVVAAGDPDDPLVVLLHGFPEFWYEWREYVAPLVAAGYRVLVPDQRGYNRSDKPDGTSAYRIRKLSRDVVKLIDTEDRESAHVVGHDWGAAVAWDLALRFPEAIERLGIVNVPHPTVMERELRSNLTQLRKSWYMFFVQLPRLPEWAFRRDDYASLVTALEESRPGTFDETDVDRYRSAWSHDGALTAMLNWYRALFRHRDSPPSNRVQPATLIIWGENDQALVPELAPKSLDYCENGRLERFPNATHWVVHEYPDEVAELLLDHLESH
jgi:pimeloyl-ACP methyl ester carboxylesterase